MAVNASGSIWAAQPVTIRRADGRSRLALRIAWRAWRTASAVTAQVLNTTAAARPSALARSRMASDSQAFSLQPKVTTSTARPVASAITGDGMGRAEADGKDGRKPGARRNRE